MKELSNKELAEVAGGFGEGGCIPAIRFPKIRWPW